MTTLDLDALQAAAEAATPQGEWKFSPWHIEEGEPSVRCNNYGLVCTTASDSTAAFIAAFNPQTARALIDRLRKAEAANQWQPIETAPKDGTHVLLWATRHSMLAPHPEFIVGAYRNGWWSGPSTLSHVIHWMPLPAAPTSADSEGAKG